MRICYWSGWGWLLLPRPRKLLLRGTRWATHVQEVYPAIKIEKIVRRVAPRSVCVIVGDVHGQAVVGGAKGAT
jgi:hypothetical protein